MLSILRRLAWPLLASLLMAGSALAQDALPDTWFKLKIKGSGYAARDDGSAPHKVGGTFKAYVHVYPDIEGTATDDGGPSLPSDSYHIDVWCQTGPDQWERTYWTTESLERSDGLVYFLADLHCSFRTENGMDLESYMTAMIRVKRDKAHAVKAATFTTLGAEIFDGTTPDGEVLRGGLRASGKEVRPDQLPFQLP